MTDPTPEEVQAQLDEALNLIDSLRGGDRISLGPPGGNIARMVQQGFGFALPLPADSPTIREPSFGPEPFNLGAWTDEQEAIEGLRLAVDVAEGQRDALKGAVRRKHEELLQVQARVAELEERLAKETRARREAERSRP